MDDITDTSKKGQDEKYLELSIRTQPFGANAAAARAYGRAERIVSALHLVTNHVSQEEPARRAIRKNGIELLQRLIELRDEMRTGGSAITNAQLTIRNLISLVRLLTAGRHMSIQNSEALAEALDELGTSLSSSQRSSLSESITFTREEFATPGQRRQSIKDKERVKDTTTAVMSNSSNRTRGESIMSILRVEGQLGIKDIASQLPEFSEKMVQRELKYLVAEGKVRKSGSKRWSVYSLAE